MYAGPGCGACEGRVSSKGGGEFPLKMTSPHRFFVRISSKGQGAHYGRYGSLSFFLV